MLGLGVTASFIDKGRWMEGAGDIRCVVPCHFAQVKLLHQQLGGPADRKRTRSLYYVGFACH